MKPRIFIRDRFDAVTPIISAILAIAIVTVAASSTIVWGIPYINELHSKETLESAEMQFNSIIDNIKDIVNGRADGQNVLSVAVNGGSISIDKSEYDRTIILYSYDNSHEFTVSQLDDTNHIFYLENLPSYNTITAEGQWLDDPDNPVYESLSVDITDGKVTVDSNCDIKGCVKISLYDSGALFGMIYLFDSNSLIFNLYSNAGIHELSLEKCGIIYFNDRGAQVKRSFNVHLDGNYFRIHVLQTLALRSFSASGGNGFTTKISVKSHGTWVQEREDIYNLRLQLHGDNAQTWLEYISNKYENKFVLSDDTLFLSESADGVQLTFLNSVVDFDII